MTDVDIVKAMAERSHHCTTMLISEDTDLLILLLHYSRTDQGLTQTFLSSGPQDHQLRESGGPTIFLVVLRIKSRHTNSYA